MAAETVDTLELQIRSSASDAAEKVRQLSTSVSDFGKNISQHLSDVNSLASAIERIVTAMEKMSGVKNLKTIMSGAAGTAAKMKEKTFGKAFQPIVPPMRPSTTVKGKTRIAQYKDGSVRKFGMTSDEIARGINSDLNGSTYTNSSLSEEISKIRNKVLENDASAMQDIRSLAETLAGGAGSKNINGLMQELNSIFGKHIIGVDDKDIAGFGESIAAANQVLKQAGARFRFGKWDKSAKVGSAKFNAMSADSAEQWGISTPEDLLKTAQAIAYRFDPQSTQLDQLGMRNTEELATLLFGNLVDQIYGSTEVKGNSSIEAVERVASEMHDAVQDAKLIKIDPAANAARRAATRGILEESLRAMNTSKAQLFNDELAQSLFESTLRGWSPEAIAHDRAVWAEKGKLDSWMGFRGADITHIADQGLAKGLIDADTANAMKDAVNGIVTGTEMASASAAEMKEELAEASAEAKNAAEGTKEIANAAEAAEGSTGRLKEIFKAIGETISGSKIGKLGSQLMRITRMRAMRYVVKELAAGMKEGISNLYEWSKASSGHFASAMDTIASKSMLAKNSIATAFAPAIEALVPVLSRVVSWVNAASNAIAQFIALLTGKSTWTKATEAATEWGSTTKKAASGAGDAVKDLLADWDELNIIQSEGSGGSGGGGGGAASEFADMFEETSVFDKWTDYFDEIKTIVGAIGAGIAGWFVLAEVESFLQKIGIAGDRVAGIFSTIRRGVTGAVLLTIGWSLASAAGKDMANNGITAQNVLMGLGSLVASAVGGKFLGGAIGKLIGGSIAGAGTIGLIAGLSIAAIIGVTAYIAQKEQNAYEAAKAWVLENAFDYDIEAKLNIINTQVDASQEARENVRAAATALLGTTNAIKLGIDDGETLALMKQQLGTSDTGLIGSLNTYAQENANLLRLRYSILPETDDQGNDVSAEKFKVNSDQWSIVTGWYEEKGRELGKYLVENEQGEIENRNPELVKTIIDQINQAVSEAQKAKIQADAIVDLDLALAANEDAKIPDVFADYKKKIEEAAAGLLTEEISNQEYLTNYLRGIAGADPSERNITAYEEARAHLEELIDGYSDNLAAIIDEMTGYGKGKIHDYFIDKYSDKLMPHIEGAFSKVSGMDSGEIGEFFAESGEEFTRKWLDYIQNDVLQNLFGNHLSGAEQDALYKWGITPDDFMPDWMKDAISIAKAVLNMYDSDGLEVEMEDEGVQNVAKEAQEYLDENPLKATVEFTDGNGEIITIDPVNPTTGGGGGSYHHPTDWYTEPSEPIQVDAATSGMALDSTVGNINVTMASKADEVGGLIESANRVLARIEAYTKATSEKDFTVNISPSTGFAQVGNRSLGSFTRVTGIP